MNVIAAIALVAGIGLLGWGGLGVLTIMEGDPGGVMANRFAEVNDWMVKSGFGVARNAFRYLRANGRTVCSTGWGRDIACLLETGLPARQVLYWVSHRLSGLVL